MAVTPARFGQRRSSKLPRSSSAENLFCCTDGRELRLIQFRLVWPWHVPGAVPGVWAPTKHLPRRSVPLLLSAMKAVFHGGGPGREQDVPELKSLLRSARAPNEDPRAFC